MRMLMQIPIGRCVAYLVGSRLVGYYWPVIFVHADISLGETLESLII